MDAIRRNKQIDSLKYLIAKCQGGNTTTSTVQFSEEESKSISQVESSIESVKNTSEGHVYQDQLLNELTAYAELRGRLHRATLSADASLLTDTERRLPSGALLAELVREVDDVGSRLASVGEHMEPLGWRLLQSTFTSGLDVPYEQHGTIKSLLNEMAVLIRDINAIEQAFQRAAMYKPDRKLGDHLTRAVRDLCELRSRLDDIRTLRHNCREMAGSSDHSTTAASAPGLSVSQLQDSVFCSDNGSHSHLSDLGSRP